MSRAVQFSTRSYESNHGAAPRGRGYWAFSFGRVYAPVFCPLPAGEKGAPTFGEAKRWALTEAARLGASYVEVCS